MRKYTIVFIFVFVSIVVKAQTYYWNGLSPVLDLQTDTVQIVVSGLPAVIDTNFGVAHICMDITHSYDSDLQITLVSPDGTVVTLIQSTGGSGDNFLGTCVGMDGTAFTNALPPYAGIFFPAGDVSDFNNGQNPNGIWLFIVSDLANADTGSIHSASVVFTNNPPNPSGSGTVIPSGNYVWPNCLCPGSATSCDLLPDMTSSAKEILLNHSETPGNLFISNTTPNIGYGPIEIYGIDSCFCGTTHVPCGTVCPDGDDIQHVIKQRIYQKVQGTDTLTFYDRFAGLMTYHADHGHLHVDNWANYTLRTQTSNPDATTWPIVGTGTKQSFCLINLGTCSNNLGECLDNNGDTVTTVPNQNLGFHTGCGLTQGIFPGRYDVYSISLNDPIPLNNVCNGNYFIVSITDPDNNFLESDETNNWVAVPITLTQQNVAPQISVGGSTIICPGDSVTLTSNFASNYLWSTGDTTQSIIVGTAGSYTVSTDCGTSVATSSPVIVSIAEVNVTVSVDSSTLTCSGDSIQLFSGAASIGTQVVPVTFTSNQQVFIPDNFSTGVTSAINISGINPASLSSNSIISVKLNLTHTYDGDLAISLISPSGNTIFLSNRRGGSGNDFINTVFSMSATTLINVGASPFTGNYKPDGNFNSLTGNVNGNWLLRVQDLAGVDTGRIQNWSIVLNNIVPETFSYSWSSVPPGFISTIQNPFASVDTPAIYNVTITSSATGCSGIQSVAVTIPSFISINNFYPSGGLPGSVVNINGSGFNNVTDVLIANIPASSFIVLNDNQVQAIVPNSPGSSDLICVENSKNCDYCSASVFTIFSATGLNLRVYIEGYYKGNGLMNAAVDPLNYPDLCDTVMIELHEINPPHNLAYSIQGTLDVYGNGNFMIPAGAFGNSYFIVVNHRNSIETWSSSTVLFNTPSLYYIFTDSKSRAYGNNMVDLGDGNFAIWSGDISDAATSVIGLKDGIIESLDYSEMENAAYISLLGYNPQDITGDGVVESADYSIMENNLYFSISLIRP